MIKIVVLDGYTENPGDLSWDGLKQFGEVAVYDRTPADQVIARIGDAQAIFSNKVVIDAQIMDACPRMKFVGLLSTGYNVVDIAAAKARGIVVCNIPAYSTPSVAQMTFPCCWTSAFTPRNTLNRSMRGIGAHARISATGRRL